jgi:hypothetical protein
MSVSLSVWLILALASAGPLRQVDAVAMTWRVERQSAPEAGARSCRVISLGGNVTARLSMPRGASAGTWSVRVGYDNQPGSVRYLRIDKKYFQTDRPSFRGGDAAEIVALLKTPGEVVFEWGKRPDYSKRGGLFATGDFAAKAAQCERWIGETRI